MNEPLVATLLSALLAAVALLEGRAPARAFGLLAISNALWNGGRVLALSQSPHAYWMIFLADLTAPPALFLLVARLTERPPGAARALGAASIIFAAIGVTTGLVLPVWQVLALYLGGSLAAAIGALVAWTRRTPSRVAKNRVRAFATGIALAGIGGLLHYTDEFGLPANQAGTLMNIVGLLVIASSVLSYGILDIGRLLGTTLVDLALGIVLGLGGVIVFDLARGAGLPPLLSVLVALGLSLPLVGRARAALRAFFESLLQVDVARWGELRAVALEELVRAGDETSAARALVKAAEAVTRANAAFFAPVRGSGGDPCGGGLIRVAGDAGSERLSLAPPREVAFESALPEALTTAVPRAGAWIPSGDGALLILEKPRGLPFYDAERALVGEVARAGELAFRRLDEERRRAAAEESALAARLAASVAHDILNPVGAIAGAAEILLRRGAEPEFSGIIRDEAARIERLCRDFLEYGRPFPLNRRPLELGEISRRVAESIRLDSAAAGGVIETEGEAHADLDADGAHRVIGNLIRNALQAGAKRVRVRVQADPARVTVDDDGPGFPENAEREVWIPFRSSKPGGTGLGLPIARRIAEAHGGTASIGRSNLGGGRVIITFAPGS
jgi:signal transduction histidine kinase